jgi:8-oxo-dGTP pyrophosphatase MutT (NUDIX family)
LNSSLDNLTEEIITQRLQTGLRNTQDFYLLDNLDKKTTVNQSPRRAAVLVPFVRINDSWHLLFTRRTHKLAEHSGQVAFPGGQLDLRDKSSEAAALREAREEIGLQPSHVRILGKLTALHTITNYLVTPIVGRIPWPYPFILEIDEVSRVFTIPLTWLAESTNYKIIEEKPPSSHNRFITIYFKTYDREILWGVTAKITLNLINTLLM